MKKSCILSIFLMIVLLTGCSKNPPEASTPTVSTTSDAKTQTGEVRLPTRTEEAPDEEDSQDETLNREEVIQIQVQGDGHTIAFELNDSPACGSLYSQLPLTIKIEDYSSNEKIFYPPEELEIGDTPLTQGKGEGSLAYFASWGNVIMYYDSFGPYSGLYDLGTAVSGGEWIEELSGEVLIEPAETSS